jgi:uncharacterized coiled-coil DUF342 family protein
MSSTQDVLRRRFAEACSERDAISKQVTPLRDQRDAILTKAHAASAKAEPLTRQIRQIEAPLYDLNNEIATISRALSGKTGANA